MTFDILTLEAIVAAVSVSASVYLFYANRRLASKEAIGLLEKDLELSNKSLQDKIRENKRLLDQNNLLIKENSLESFRDKENRRLFDRSRELARENNSLLLKIKNMEQSCCRCNDVVKKVTTSVHYSGDKSE